MAEDLSKEWGHTPEDIELWEQRIRKASKALEREYQSEAHGALYEMLCISLEDREHYQGDLSEEKGWDYTRVPTWALEAAIHCVGEYLKHSQSNGRGRNAKWLSKYEQYQGDWFRAMNVYGIKNVRKCSLEEAIEEVAEDEGISPETIKKSLYRIKKGKDIGSYGEEYYQFVDFLRVTNP